MGDIVLVTGGARSGKSRYAEQIVTEYGDSVVYLATMPVDGDAELAIRVEAHRSRRPANWLTVEEPLEVRRVLTSLDPAATVLLDCLTLWVSNLLFRAVPDVTSATATDWSNAIDGCVVAAVHACEAQAGREGPLIAVTNEVGLGTVPGDPLSRAFRDAAGLVNQQFAAVASKVVFMVSGRPLLL